jgi:hypothetical protein
MVKLAQELVDRICSFLENSDLSQTLTPQSKFHAATERCSGVFEEFTITEDNAQKLLSTYSGYRFKYLRCIIFKLILSGLDVIPTDNNLSKKIIRNSEEELQKDDGVFTKQIQYLLIRLRYRITIVATSG